ncbi:MAG: orc1/cdc6 family replication initiation protein [Candidatus Aenigmatarchaeota archaeon]
MEIDLLSEDYLPKELPHRENEIRDIHSKIQKFLLYGKFYDLLIYGPPGIGKTAAIKIALSNISAKSIYINCWKYNDTFSILQKVLEEFKQIIPKKGISKEEVIERFLEICKKVEKFIIVLDEVDKVKDLNELLYLILREAKNVLLILISNSKDFILSLEERVLSSLNLETIEFKKYSFEQLKDIAKYRLNLLNLEYESAVIVLLANESYKRNSDVRVILKLAKLAIEKMIEENSKILQVKHLKEVLNKIEESEKFEDERLNRIMQIVREKEKVTTSEVFEIIEKEFNISRRTFNNLVKELIKLGKVKLIRAKGVKGSKFYIKKL